jgi:hypothetical protein
MRTERTFSVREGAWSPVGTVQAGRKPRAIFAHRRDNVQQSS